MGDNQRGIRRRSRYVKYWASIKEAQEGVARDPSVSEEMTSGMNAYRAKRNQHKLPVHGRMKPELAAILERYEQEDQLRRLRDADVPEEPEQMQSGLRSASISRPGIANTPSRRVSPHRSRSGDSPATMNEMQATDDGFAGTQVPGNLTHSTLSSRTNSMPATPDVGYFSYPSSINDMNRFPVQYNPSRNFGFGQQPMSGMQDINSFPVQYHSSHNVGFGQRPMSSMQDINSFPVQYDSIHNVGFGQQLMSSMQDINHFPGQHYQNHVAGFVPHQQTFMHMPDMRFMPGQHSQHNDMLYFPAPTPMEYNPGVVPAQSDGNETNVQFPDGDNSSQIGGDTDFNHDPQNMIPNSHTSVASNNDNPPRSDDADSDASFITSVQIYGGQFDCERDFGLETYFEE